MNIVTELEFRDRLVAALRELPERGEIGCVTGPGRSGAVAAVYASYFLGVPFIAWGTKPPFDLNRLLIIDTARQSGKTLRKAMKTYHLHDPTDLAIYEEPPRVHFWYEPLSDYVHGQAEGNLFPLAA